MHLGPTDLSLMRKNILQKNRTRWNERNNCSTVWFRDFSLLLFIQLLLAYDAEMRKENDRTDFQVSKQPHGCTAGHSISLLYRFFSIALPRLGGYILAYDSIVAPPQGLKEDLGSCSQLYLE